MIRFVPERRASVVAVDPVARAHYEQALAACLAWRSGADLHLEAARQADPLYAMPLILQAWLLFCSRDPQRVRSALPLVEQARRLATSPRERRHLAAIEIGLADDYEGAKLRLGRILRADPHDLLALHVAHSLDYVTGDIRRLRDRVAAVLPAWSTDMPNVDAVLAMHAFGLEECGEFERAEAQARHALALNPANARAHHVMAHVFEMTDRAAEGIRWMAERAEHWAHGSVVATHAWWHVALFHLTCGDVEGALSIYDRAVMKDGTATDLADLIDASALLWRIGLRGAAVGARWQVLAQAWRAHLDDRFCSFSDLHAMMALVGAGEWQAADGFERALAASKTRWTRYGKATAVLGLPACRGLIAYGRGDHRAAFRLLGSLSAMAHRLGGSHAQRHVLKLTMLRSYESLRRNLRVTPMRPAMAWVRRAFALPAFAKP